jgi:hypothetical protein
MIIIHTHTIYLESDIIIIIHTYFLSGEHTIIIIHTHTLYISELYDYHNIYTHVLSGELYDSNFIYQSNVTKSWIVSI